MKKRMLKVFAISALLLSAGGVVANNTFHLNKDDSAIRAEAAETSISSIENLNFDCNTSKDIPVGLNYDSSKLTFKNGSSDLKNKDGKVVYQKNSYSYLNYSKSNLNIYFKTNQDCNLSFDVFAPNGGTRNISLYDSNAKLIVASPTTSAQNTIYNCTAKITSNVEYYFSNNKKGDMAFLNITFTPVVTYGSTTFKLDGGNIDGNLEDVICQESETVTSVVAPDKNSISKAGHVFEYWYLEGDQTQTEVTNFDWDKVYVAKWKKLTLEHLTLSLENLNELYYGDSLTITCKGKYDGIENEETIDDCTFDISHPDLVKIENNILTVIDNVISDTNVTIKAKKDNIESDSVSVVVKAEVYKNIALSSENENVQLEKSLTLNLSGLNHLNIQTDLTNLATWDSSNKDVATVENGVVTTLTEGTTNVTAVLNDVTYTCVIEVKKIYASEITLNKTDLTLKVGKKDKLVATMNPADANDKVLFKSLNEEIATIDNEGNVTALSEGTTTLVAYSEANENVKVECNIEVVSNTYNVDFSSAEYQEFSSEAGQYNFDGFNVNYNKKSGDAFQLGDISFDANYDGYLYMYYKETGNNKNRQLEIKNIDGTFEQIEPMTENDSKGKPTDHKFKIFLKKGSYTIKNIDLDDSNKSSYINLYKISFDRVLLMQNQKGVASDGTTAARFVGTLTNIDDPATDVASIDMSLTLSFADSTETYVANKSLYYLYTSINDDTNFAAKDGTYYFFFVVSGLNSENYNGASITCETTITLNDGTTIVDSTTFHN